MIHTLETLAPLVGTRKFPPYFFLISCHPEEKEVLAANLHCYLDDVHWLLWTTEESKMHSAHLKTDALHKAIYRRVVGQLMTDKSFYIVSYAVVATSFMTIGNDERSSLPVPPDFHFMFQQALNDAIEMLICNINQGFSSGNVFPQDLEKRATIFLGHVMLLGYNKLHIPSKKVVRK